MFIFSIVYAVSFVGSIVLAAREIYLGIKEDMRKSISLGENYIPEWTYFDICLVGILSILPVINTIVVIVILYEHADWFRKLLSTSIVKKKRQAKVN